MREELSGSCCVLCKAMNFDGAGDPAETPESALFQAIVAAVGAIGFVMLFIL